MPQFRSESSVAAAALSPRTFGRRPDRATVVCAPTDRYFVVKVRRGGAGTPVGAPGFQPQTAVDHRGLRPKLRLNTAISNRKLRSADRNFGRSPLFPTATSVAKTATSIEIAVANRGLQAKAASSADAQRVAMSKSKASKAVSEAEISAQDRALLNAFLNAKVEKRPTPLKQPGKRWPRVTSP